MDVSDQSVILRESVKIKFNFKYSAFSFIRHLIIATLKGSSNLFSIGCPLSADMMDTIYKFLKTRNKKKMNKTRLNKPDNKSGLNFGGIKYCGPFHPQNFWEDLVSLIDHFKIF